MMLIVLSNRKALDLILRSHCLALKETSPFTYGHHHSHASLLFQPFLLKFLKRVLDPEDDLAASFSSPLHHMTLTVTNGTSAYCGYE